MQLAHVKINSDENVSSENEHFLRKAVRLGLELGKIKSRKIKTVAKPSSICWSSSKR
jgi:hypothetical protein